jgi:hypothetical protein
MASRLGNVLYWLGCLIAAVIFIGGYLMMSGGGYKLQFPDYLVIGLPAIVAWLIGRAFRYVLAGN